MLDHQLINSTNSLRAVPDGLFLPEEDGVCPLCLALLHCLQNRYQIYHHQILAAQQASR
jgi:hypothetical protein